MKKTLMILFTLLLVLSTFGCMTLFQALSVDPPLDQNSSMIALEVAHDGSYLLNNNATGWAPIVTDENGNILPFRMLDALSGAMTLYVIENVTPGTYTFSAMRHVYTDFGLLPDDIIPSYEPYVSTPYHINQEFPLPKPIVVEVKPGEIATLGYHDLSFQDNGGGFADKDDRYKILPNSFRIVSEPDSLSPLEVIRNSLNSTNWAPWNERNPVK